MFRSSAALALMLCLGRSVDVQATGTTPARTTLVDRDVLGGRVLSGHGPVVNATVTVTDVGAPTTAVPHSARTDSSGRWLVAVQDGTGDYAVRAIAFGFEPAHRSARRDAARKPIVVDFLLEALPETLDIVHVVATVRPRPAREIAAQDRTASERASSEFAGAVATGDQGNLAAMAASTPGTLLTTDPATGVPAITVLGLPADQNRTTLNGLGFAVGDIPRDAIVATRIATTSFDVSRGGFSGAGLSVNIAPGTNYHIRMAHLTLDEPRLQATDATGRRSGTQYANAQVSGAVNGPIRHDRVFYNAAFQGGRRSSSLPSLTGGDDAAFTSYGVSADSVQRFLSLLGARGIPFTMPGTPAARTVINASVLGRIDWFRSPRLIGNVVVSARHRQNEGTFTSVLATPASGGATTTRGANVIASLSAYLAGNVLNDLRVGAHLDRARSRAYLGVPDAAVRVGRELPGGATSTALLEAGGNAQLPQRSAGSGAELYNMLSWHTTDRRHRVRVLANVRSDALAASGTTAASGLYAFNSLDDLAADRPYLFTRTWGSRTATVRSVTGALAAGDEYKPSDRLQIMYGVRLDANAFTSKPRYRADIDSAFAIRTDRVPRLVDVGPRIGFFRAFGHNGTTGIPGFGAPWGSVRGGVGLFRNDVAAGLLLPVVASLEDGLQQLTCLGDAVPTPAWDQFLRDPATIPAACRTGTLPQLSNSRTDIATISRRLTATRSWRASLSLNAFLVPKVVRFTIEGTYSLNLGQPSLADANFSATSRFTLSAEDNRQVFTSPASIAAASGASTIRDSRLHEQFGAVTVRGSDLRSGSRQLVFTLFPAPGDALGRLTQWSASYSLQQVRERFGGLLGTTGRDPNEVAWSRGTLDARHQLMLSAVTRVGALFSIATSARFTSGLPYTPLVSADINGDGFRNDRAFVPTPADGNTASAMQTLLATSSTRTRRCLQSQTGTIARRNSCEGSWSGMMNAALLVNPERLGWQNRVQLSLAATNVLGGIDQLLHGAQHTHGWGQPVLNDPVLLNVRGFDRTLERYRYDVNGSFGDARATTVRERNPFTLTIEARVQLGHDYTSQALDQALAPGRSRPGRTVTFEEMKAALVESVYNPIRGLLAARDSLSVLTNEQAAELARLYRDVARAQDSIVTPLAHYMAALPREYDKRDLGRRLLVMQNALFDVVVDGMQSARAVFTADQIDELPVMLRASFDIPRLKRARPVAGFPIDN